MPGPSNPKIVALAIKERLLSIPQTLQMVSGVVQGWNVSIYTNAYLNVNSNFTMPFPSGLYPGASGMLSFLQDVTGSRLITWSSGYNSNNGVKPALTLSVASAVDHVAWYSLDGKNITVNVVQNVS